MKGLNFRKKLQEVKKIVFFKEEKIEFLWKVKVSLFKLKFVYLTEQIIIDQAAILIEKYFFW